MIRHMQYVPYMQGITSLDINDCFNCGQSHHELSFEPYAMSYDDNAILRGYCPNSDMPIRVAMLDNSEDAFEVRQLHVGELDDYDSYDSNAYKLFEELEDYDRE